MLRHDRSAPFDTEGALSFEHIKGKCRGGHKVNFQREVIASLCPEDGNVRFQVVVSQDGWFRLLRVRAIPGHSVPVLKHFKMSHETLTCGEIPSDSSRGHGVERPTARTLIHATREHHKNSIMKKGLLPGGPVSTELRTVAD